LLFSVDVRHQLGADVAQQMVRQQAARNRERNRGAWYEPREVAAELMAQGMRGELTAIAAKGQGANFRIVRPGTIYEIAWANGTAKVRTNKANFMGMLNRIHHVGGMWHDFTLTNVWGFFVGVVSVSLLILGITGIYMWFKIHQERATGTVLLVLGMGYGLSLLVLIRTA
jgi:hypothetical protein